MSETTVVVSYRALPGQSNMAEQAISSLVATVLSEEAECGGITILQDSNEAERIMLIERWPSQEYFLGPHMQQPHVQFFIQNAGAFLAGPPDISFWHPASAA